MSNQSAIIWDGNADTANKVFGERYGVDWWYVPESTSIIVKNGQAIRRLDVGDLVEIN